jgi:hypothetical protein
VDNINIETILEKSYPEDEPLISGILPNTPGFYFTGPFKKLNDLNKPSKKSEEFYNKINS